ncbi:hypothetical protein [Altererythrobacter sp. MTPC7]|uniref:hypothetical protein n=1 Tax=Altererythrobacter sp. MTPC7 TaxID=3056567 RepID=UPI0036F4107C
MTPAFALILVATASQGGDGVVREGQQSVRESTIRSEARAAVTILKPEIIDFSEMKGRGERARIRRDADGTVWLEFS